MLCSVRFIQSSTFPVCSTLYLSPFIVRSVGEMSAVAQSFNFFYVDVIYVGFSNWIVNAHKKTGSRPVGTYFF